jgi:hypothetical protein
LLRFGLTFSQSFATIVFVGTFLTIALLIVVAGIRVRRKSFPLSLLFLLLLELKELHALPLVFKASGLCFLVTFIK